MDDLVTIARQSTQLSLPAQAPTVQGARGATAMPPQNPPSSAPLPAGESVRRGIAPPRARLYVVASPLDAYYAEAVATGTVDAIESEAGRQAPVGSLLLRDSDDGSRGVVVAERQGDGWVLTGGAAS